ncbi:MAG: hypothetical protein PHW56_00475 [Methanosarcinaceae archaeon]|nr:hypothetical protein [Methanosarcinaceae archaeon]
MNKWIKLTGGPVLLIIVLVLLAALLAQHNDEIYEDTLTSNYKYDITIRCSSELQNATFYLPAPIFENESGKFEKPGKSLKFKEEDFYGRPPDWNFSIEETEHGPMLRIEAEKIRPDFRSMPVAISETGEIEGKAVEKVKEDSEETKVPRPFDFGTRLEVEPLINTRNPEGNEPLLLPKYGLKVSEKSPLVPPPEHIRPQYYDYGSRVYASYESSPETLVEIYVSLRGSNEWWVYGWTWNEYSDRVSVKLTGPQEGWIPVGGSLITADGVYMD